MTIGQLDAIIDNVIKLSGVSGPYANSAEHKCYLHGIRLIDLMRYLHFANFQLYIVDEEIGFMYKIVNQQYVVAALHKIAKEHRSVITIIKSGIDIKSTMLINTFVKIMDLLQCKIRLYNMAKSQFDPYVDMLMEIK